MTDLELIRDELVDAGAVAALAAFDRLVSQEPALTLTTGDKLYTSPLAQPKVPEGYQQIGWTNAAQVSYVKDESGSVYPDQDHGCDIPVFIPAAKEEGK